MSKTEREVIIKTMIGEEKTHLPWEIMANILSRLAAKTLMRFRCVCKQWRNLIHDPSFITTHTASHISTNDDTRYILYSHDDYNVNGDNYPYCRYYKPDEVERKLLSFSLLKKVKIHGSCNGLLCLAVKGYKPYMGHVFFLWNPSIMKLKALPSNPMHAAFHNVCFRYYAIGFGFSKKKKIDVDDDYKVVMIAYFHNFGKLDGIPPPRVEIYTLSTNSWKSMDDDDVVVPARIDGGNLNSDALVNGAVHWFCAEKNTILSFDLDEEVFQEMVLPPNYSVGGRRCETRLGNFRETLSVIACSSFSPRVCYMWAMKEYGVVESWTRLFTVEITQNIARPLCVGNNGFLLKDGFGSIVLFECEDQQCRTVPGCALEEAFVYTETLVLLNEDDDDNFLKKVEDHHAVLNEDDDDDFFLNEYDDDNFVNKMEDHATTSRLAKRTRY